VSAVPGLFLVAQRRSSAALGRRPYGSNRVRCHLIQAVLEWRSHHDKVHYQHRQPQGLKLEALLEHARADFLKRCYHKVDDPRPDAGITLRNNIKIMGRLGQCMERAHESAKPFKPLDQNRRNLRYFESISLKASAVGRIVFGLG